MDRTLNPDVILRKDDDGANDDYLYYYKIGFNLWALVYNTETARPKLNLLGAEELSCSLNEALQDEWLIDDISERTKLNVSVNIEIKGVDDE